MKQLVWTNMASINTIELQHLSSEVEDKVRTNYDNKKEVEGDDEL